jgi:hypothetical protein
MKRLFTVTMILLVLCAVTTAFAFANNPLKVFVNGKEVIASLLPVYQKDRLYLPVEDIVQAIGQEITVTPDKIMIQKKLPGKTYEAEDEYLVVKILPLENYSTSTKYIYLEYTIQCRPKYASSVKVSPRITISKVRPKGERGFSGGSGGQSIRPHLFTTGFVSDPGEEAEYGEAYHKATPETRSNIQFPKNYEIARTYLVETSMFNPEPPYTIRLEYTIDKPLVEKKEERTLLIPISE